MTADALAGIRVVDFSTQIAGPYCSKLFADAGAGVVKVGPPAGDPLRRWSASGADLGDDDSALFCFLNAGKRSVAGTPDDPHVAALVAEADLVIEARGLAYDAGERLDVAGLRAQHPALVVVSITPYGLDGPWADRAATEFTLQAEAGSIGIRGLMGQEPFQAGGRLAEWAGGACAAAAALPAVLRARDTGRGEHVDVSLLETANFVFANYSVTMNRLFNGGPGVPEHAFLAPAVETPSIEPTADGYVGFCTNARQQFADFLVLIERSDLLDDEELAQFGGRLARFEEWNKIVHAWCSSKTTDEILELASLLRVPVSPVCNGATVVEQPHLVERGVHRPDPSGRFLEPRPPYRIEQGDELPHGDGGGRWRSWNASRDGGPLAGLRVLDLSAWWAGPAAAHVLATLGADVVHVESPKRPDGMRMVGGMMAANYPQWWEASPHFLHANTNKRGVTLDLDDPTGFALVERLIGWSDVVIENFTPRVLDNFGLTWARVQELNPNASLVRMPAFGLTGPWRDRPGFAQNVEQLSGLAWVTGHPDDQPRIPRGPCDPIAGFHAAFAIVVALAERVRTGHGLHVEIPLAEIALNIAAEQVVEWTAYGRLLEREGNRSPLAAPQGLYPCAGATTPFDGWVAVSVATDAQWRALVSVLDDPAWAADPALDSLAGRRAAHDEIDAHLRAWTAARPQADVVAHLRAAGVTASPLADPSRLLEHNPQLQARRYFEAPAHPVVGPMPLPSLPFRYASVENWLRTPAPTLGEHNGAVLGDILGLDEPTRRDLEAAGVIARHPLGAGSE